LAALLKFVPATGILAIVAIAQCFPAGMQYWRLWLFYFLWLVCSDHKLMLRVHSPAKENKEKEYMNPTEKLKHVSGDYITFPNCQVSTC
jgi:hypothetical protein